MVFQISFGPISWLMVSEIFPIRTRARGISLAGLTNFGSNALVTFAFLPLKVLICFYQSISFKAGISLFIVFILLWLIEYGVLLNIAGASRSGKPLPSFRGYCFVVTCVCSVRCPRDQRFELGRDWDQNFEVKARICRNEIGELPIRQEFWLLCRLVSWHGTGRSSPLNFINLSVLSFHKSNLIIVHY